MSWFLPFHNSQHLGALDNAGAKESEELKDGSTAEHDNEEYDNVLVDRTALLLKLRSLDMAALCHISLILG